MRPQQFDGMTDQERAEWSVCEAEHRQDLAEVEQRERAIENGQDDPDEEVPAEQPTGDQPAPKRDPWPDCPF